MRDLTVRIDEKVKILQRKEAFIQRLSNDLDPLREEIQRLMNQRTKQLSPAESCPDQRG